MTQIRASEAVLSEDTYVAVDTPAFVGAPAPSFLCLEWCAFGRCTETASKIDRASDNGNARRREPSSILLYNYGFFVRAEADPHRFERFALIRRGQVECVIPNDGIVYRAHPAVAVEDNELREGNLHQTFVVAGESHDAVPTTP